MTIPDDVRAIIHLALIEYNRHTAMGVGVALAWLDAQPAAPEPTERWEPVEDGCHGNVRQRDGSLLLDMGIEEDETVIRLPAGYALCRRVEVTP